MRSKKQDLRVNALDELFNASAEYRESKSYLNFLNFVSKIRVLSTYNAALVRAQNSAVQYVLTYKQWKKYDRRVIPHARPLVILRPFGPVDFVFDITDTIGPPLPKEISNPFLTEGDFDYNLYKYSFDNSKKIGIKTTEAILTGNIGGYVYKPSDFEIVINKAIEIKEKYSSLIHELGHIFCGHMGNRGDDWWKERSNISNPIKEIEAESVSFLVCKRAGLKTSSESYLSEYVKSNPTLPDFSVDCVLKAVDYIEKMNKQYFDPNRKKKSSNS